MKKLKLTLAALLAASLLQGCGTSGAVPGTDSPGSTLGSGAAGTDVVPTITYMGFAVVQQGTGYSAKIVVFFSEDMDPNTIIPANFLVRDDQGRTVAGSMQYIGVTAVYTPTQRFDAKSKYSITVGTGVRSAGGIALAKPKTWDFTTPDPSELTGVVVDVASVAPETYATDVPLNSGVNVTFGQLMDPATVNPTTVSVLGPDGTALAGEVHYSGVTASFVPRQPFAPNTTYRLVVSNAVKSLAGVNMDDSYRSVFTTGTTAGASAPHVIFDAPADGDTGVGLDGAMVVDFDQPMDTTTINSSTIMLTDQYGRSVDGSVTYTGSTAVFTPDAPLLPLSQYTLDISGQVASSGGMQMQSDYSFSFTTAAFSGGAAPNVVFTNPSPWQSRVSRTSAISAAFSETLDPVTLDATSVQLQAPDGSLVQGTVSYLGSVVSFTPSSPLAYATTYTMVLSGAIKGQDGTAMGGDYSWSFTTSQPM